jgi:cyclic beta-1,2-glucan synthetase
VRDRPGEALYLRDEQTAQVWTPTPAPAGAETAHLIRHGVGYSVFETHSHGLKQRLHLFAAPQAPVKIARLQLENIWEHPRRLTATYFAEWVLGVHRDAMQQYLFSTYHAEHHALLVRNPYQSEFGERVAFLSASEETHGFTADRTEFLGRLGNVRRPAGLQRIGLSGDVQPGQDPCAALQLHINLQPGESKEIYFLLGQGADQAEALHWVKQFQNPQHMEEAWQAVNQNWDDLLTTTTVDTPDEAMNLLLNRWLPYQNLSCRIWGRSAFYQSGGAYGFRDQLQDVMAALHLDPAVARQHILRAARHQFAEGDVLHWWHPPSGRGVRTRITDDLLWLPYVTAHYVEVTGDTAVLQEQIPFRQGDPLQEDEEERYNHFAVTEEKHSLYEHCCRALEKGSTAGTHGLPLMGGGDWNDGMNRVGIEGEGESVWLGWFLYATLRDFAPLCQQMGDEDRAQQYRQQMDNLQEALQEHAWDGEWYLRAFYDDGSPLGSAQNRECRIDAIAQSWAVLSGAGDAKRARQGMEAVDKQLIQEADRLLLLFTPPFDRTAKDPGYIKGYPPGIRENGGQYTHAAIWTTWAFAELGDGDRAGALFNLLNPIRHSDTPAGAERYRVEPYVTAADIYNRDPLVGQGGWTWYTGSGSWLYRLGLEAILGLQKRGDQLFIRPCIPATWREYSITLRHGKATYHIQVENPDGVQNTVSQWVIDGEARPDGAFPLVDDGQRHHLKIVMGANAHA